MNTERVTIRTGRVEATYYIGIALMDRCGVCHRADAHMHAFIISMHWVPPHTGDVPSLVQAAREAVANDLAARRVAAILN